ncbi:MAG: hypothetical protein JNK50_08655 [Bacteroidia bacterium]|nr:hypothetical protein [Bacteroidia bacterium]
MEEPTPGSIVNKKQGGVSRLGTAELGPAFWNGAATAAMPFGVLIFLFTFFIKEKSKNKKARNKHRAFSLTKQ